MKYCVILLILTVKFDCRGSSCSLLEQKGIQKGREEGENALGKLMDILLSKGDVANAKLAATDEKARKELYRKYGIIEKP